MPTYRESVFGNGPPEPCPAAGDAAFAEGNPEKPTVAALQWLAGLPNLRLPADRLAEHWHNYAQGFRCGAEGLGAWVISEAGARRLMQPDIDRIALPLITLWRHYLELILKTMVLALGQAGDLRKKDHKLTELWEVARPLLETLMADAEWEQLDAVGAVVIEFSDLDPLAQLSRYPSDKEGAELFLPRLPSTLDMGHMDETMRGVANFFQGCWAPIGAIREAEAEAAAYRSEF